MILHWASVLLASVAVLSTSCNEDNEDKKVVTPEFPKPQSLTIPAGETTCPVTFTPNMDWTISIPTDPETSKWFELRDGEVSVTSIQGKASKDPVTVTIATTDQVEFDATPSCEVSLTMGGQTQVIATITRGTTERQFDIYQVEFDEYGQLFNPGIYNETPEAKNNQDSPIEMFWTYNGALEYVFKATSNFSWLINIPEEAEGWFIKAREVDVDGDNNSKEVRFDIKFTTEEILEKLRSRHPIVGKILDQRGIRKLLSTYINALPELINPKTGKIHTSFNQTVTATGRLSSSNPNLQNIPIRDNEGREIRRAFVPDPGCVFFSADYSQIELRIMAHLSGDRHMIEAFREGSDIHAATAAKIYKIPIDKVTSDMRRKAKTANFGIIYGISVFGLAERLNIPRSEAKTLIDGYFESYPQIKEYMNRSIEVAREKGFVETICGRKRMLPDIHSHNSVVRGYAERNAINAPIQGSAADIIKIAMIRIARRLEEGQLKSRMILQVHDELNFNVPAEELEQVKAIVREEMENAYSLQVPLLADCGTGANWLEAH